MKVVNLVPVDHAFAVIDDWRIAALVAVTAICCAIVALAAVAPPGLRRRSLMEQWAAQIEAPPGETEPT
jgi:hypothetical protein